MECKLVQPISDKVVDFRDREITGANNFIMIKRLIIQEETTTQFAGSNNIASQYTRLTLNRTKRRKSLITIIVEDFNISF